jgi:Ca2+-binding EF-hand superfamily protein
LEDLFYEIDKDGNGYISFNEFLELMNKLNLTKGIGESEFKMIFDFLDKEHLE